MIALLAAVLTTFILLGTVGDFAIGKAGNQDLKARLSDFYRKIDGDWRGTYQLPARLIGQFIVGNLRRRPYTFLTVALVLNTSYVWVMLLAADGVASFLESPAGLKVFRGLIQSPTLFLLFSINVIPDALSWTATLLIVGRMGTASAGRAVSLMAAAILAWAAAWWLQALFLSFFVIADPQASHVGWASEVLLYGLGFSEPDFGLASHTLIAGMGVFAAIPIELYLLTTLIGVLVYVARPILRRPLALIVVRLGEADKPVLTMAAIVGAVAATITAWAKVGATPGH